MSGNHRPRSLSVIGVPTSAGAYGPGQERAPATFRRHGLLDALRITGREIVDQGDGAVAEWRPDAEHPAAANVGSVGAIASGLADEVAVSLAADRDVLVLGGDCTIELGTVAGALRDEGSVALAYVDLDADLHTPETGDGILDWMGVAHILGVPGADQDLSRLAGHRPMLDAGAVRLVATDNITPPEQAVIDSLGLHIEPLTAVVDDPEAVAARTREWAQRYDRVLVHVDVDVLDVEKFPIAEHTDRRGGLLLTQLTGLLETLCALPNWRALTIAEVNPAHAADEADSFARLIAMLTSALAAPPQLVAD